MGEVSLRSEKGIVLGNVISSGGIEVDKAKINLIAYLPSHIYVNDVRSFLVHAGFYHRFIKDFSKIAKPLSSLLAKDVPFHFAEECLEAFNKLKRALMTTFILHPLVWGEAFELMCDSSNYAVGMILGQCIGKKPYVIYYARHTLSDA